MEVLPCSDVQYVGESDAKQSSGADFVFDGESNCIQNENQVQMEDVRMDDLLNEQGPLLETQGEGQGTGTRNEFPISQGHHSGGLQFDSQVEGQRSCGSHDFDDDDLNAQNDCTGPYQASENSNLIVDTIESELPCDNREGESSLSEPQWLEHDESVALWVKVIANVYIFNIYHIYFLNIQGVCAYFVLVFVISLTI